MRQAGHRDFRVATDTDSNFAFRVHHAAATVAASTINAGDWVLYDGEPWFVYDVTVNGDEVTWQLGLGLWTDPQVTLLGTDLVRPSDPLTMSAVEARYQPPTRVDAPDTVEIPTSLLDSNTVASLDFTADWLDEIQAGIDWLGDGTSGLHAPYDVIVTIDGNRIRVLEGAITFIRSTASRAVPEPA